MNKIKTVLTKPRLLIIGGGFAGLYTLLNLKKQDNFEKFDISLITPVNYFLFTPLLHEVAAGSLSPDNVVEPLRNKFADQVKIILDSVRIINLDQGLIMTTSGKNLAYDYLVAAPGAVTNWFKVPGAEQNALPLKTLTEALAIKDRLISVLEQAVDLVDKDKSSTDLNRLLTWVVVGGGPTGVELAAELSHLVKRTVFKLYPLLADKIKIILLQRGPELLKEFSPRFRQQAQAKLKQQGVIVKFDAEVVEVNKTGLRLKNNDWLDSSLIVWLTGVQPAMIDWQGQITKLNSGQIKVKPNLQLENYSNVYVLGDSAAVIDVNNSQPLPQLAQVAVNEAKQTANNLLKQINNQPLQEFVYKSKGQLVSLGQWLALAEIGHLFFTGHLAWWLWRTVYLSKLLTWRKKFQVAWDWTLNIFFPRDLYKN